jgi:hypothetical protein
VAWIYEAIAGINGRISETSGVAARTLNERKNRVIRHGEENGVGGFVRIYSHKQ